MFTEFTAKITKALSKVQTPSLTIGPLRLSFAPPVEKNSDNPDSGKPECVCVSSLDDVEKDTSLLDSNNLLDQLIIKQLIKKPLLKPSLLKILPPLKQNRGKPPNRYDPDVEERRSRYLIVNYVSTKEMADSLKTFIKPRRPGEDAYYGNDDVMSARKIRPFDDDKGPLVSVKPDPRVDSRASVFIANFHAARISESESQIFQQADGNAA
ncbi:hypothetical protein SADUNF_Sadunf05G0002200 [Salix dunnii]|uniref:Uncharacterized protein n=1 Tax=Salix dunnii TaxID=1413687 RepID=A0A835K610_9ROSI|nr:hypothetical protein SADUNF_Sadunf05G0002200 [Salix dunnii]